MAQMRVVFAGSVPKSLDYPESNEDCYCISDEMRRLVVCDGASESYDSKTWAQNLVQQFIEDPAINEEWVARAVRTYATAHDVGGLPWSKQAAYERGSFSTLLGVEFNLEGRCLEILTIGDSVAMLVDEGKIVRSWPYSTAAQFDERPSLLSTNLPLNGFINEKDFYLSNQVSWDLDCYVKPTLLCMTDALGQWALRMVERNDSSWTRLLEITDVEVLSELVTTARSSKLMRTDDSTLVVIQFDGSEDA